MLSSILELRCKQTFAGNACMTAQGRMSSVADLILATFHGTGARPPRMRRLPWPCPLSRFMGEAMR